MVPAAIPHARREEPGAIAFNAVLLTPAAVVAWGRFGPHSFSLPPYKEPPLMRVTVFGATGTIGRLVVQHLLDDGHQVTALVHTPAKLTTLTHSELTVVAGQLSEELPAQPVDIADERLRPVLRPRVVLGVAVAEVGFGGLFRLVVVERLLVEGGHERLVVVSGHAVLLPCRWNRNASGGHGVADEGGVDELLEAHDESAAYDEVVGDAYVD